MAAYGSTDRVRRSAAEEYINPARAQKQSTVSIQIGPFEKLLVRRGVLQPNRFPIVCNALKSRKFLSENNLTLIDVKAPPSGQSSTVTYTYRLEREPKPSSGAQTPDPAAPTVSSFAQLRGLLQRTYKNLGGAEKFHRTERESWER